MKHCWLILLLLGGGGRLASNSFAEVLPSGFIPRASGQVNGSQTSVGQSGSPSPFDRYLALQREHLPEPILMQAAIECGVNVVLVRPRYAQKPGSSWKVVPDLTRALSDQETDFYGTVAVWHRGDGVLVERWRMELDTGDYSRQIVCLRNSRTVFFDATDWPAPIGDASSSQPGWGYEQRWTSRSDDTYQKVLGRFVDLQDRPMNPPRLDDETQKDLDYKWTIHTWNDLELPARLLQ
ncbi:MAG TPA: hypothetical protein VME68_19950 [Acidobacteriaceae bacterium]|nr:hypothetical protein [Acidobacteriaceae bacterium]